jgi:hypothetical protein
MQFCVFLVRHAVKIYKENAEVHVSNCKDILVLNLMQF